MVRKIESLVSEETLWQDLEKYRRAAIDMGATDARVITSDMVIIDERVRAKCIVPMCDSYGICANCPPYAIDLDLVRKLVQKFRYGIFIQLKTPPEALAGPDAIPKKLTGPSRRKMWEIVAKIESQAFFDGYHLAIGFAVGSCKSVFCPEIECSAVAPGKACRHPLKARVSMEGAGMDAFTMAAKVGWDIYPIGAATSPTEVPHGSRLALALIY